METVSITGVSSEMKGVGRLSDGRVVFIPGALPGECAEIEIVRQKERFCEALLISIAGASADRQESACPYSERCGGCAARHMRYEATLRYKRTRVFDALSRIGRIETPAMHDTIGCANPQRCRNKAEYAISGTRIGTLAAASHEILEIDDCLLQKESSVQAMLAVRSWLRGRQTNPLRYLVTRVNCFGDLCAVLSADGRCDLSDLVRVLRERLPSLCSVFRCDLNQHYKHALDGNCVKLYGSDAIEDTLCGLRFSLSPQSFFQVNTAQAEALCRKAVEYANLTGSETVYDLYCGVGTISLCLAQNAARVTGIEIIPQAIDNARVNALKNSLQDRTLFLCGDVAKVLPGRASKAGSADTVILDPPRSGCDRRVLEAVSAIRPERIVYVSCDPGTLARDLRVLLESGSYRFGEAQPVDMFPWTEHVETVCCLYHQKKDYISVPYEPKDAEYLK
ncbi:MAG: 23S rRNA (uracil(1939)-C(5))-methyltransferase RlmD [Clostridia bacterium]|nr:23S rRNA (uracil(1939)-C(5))-methyltransferase RlmD [Clostridia bacterium]